MIASTLVGRDRFLLAEKTGKTKQISKKQKGAKEKNYRCFEFQFKLVQRQLWFLILNCREVMPENEEFKIF